jgi:two-component system response regulator NreC
VVRRGLRRILTSDPEIDDAEDLDLIAGVKSVARGGVYFSPSVSPLLVEGARDRPATTAVEETVWRLTRCEREVLQLIAEGKNNPEIGRVLMLSPNTVEAHRKHIMEKLALRNTAEIVRFAVRAGIVR